MSIDDPHLLMQKFSFSFHVFTRSSAWVVSQLKLTPKAFINLSPGFEHRENPGEPNKKIVKTPKGFGSWRTLSALLLISIANPGLTLRSNRWAELANAFGVNSNCDTTSA
jgi:hypothetical protein